MSDDFHTLTLSDARPETDSATSLRFALPDELREQFRFQPGQFLTLRAQIDGAEVRRNYSLACQVTDAEPRLVVKRAENGTMSRHINDHFTAGMSVAVKAPSGRFVLPATDAPRHLIALASGSGITPIYAMIAHVLENEPASRVTLVYGNRDRAHVLLAEDLAALQERHQARLRILSVFSREADVAGPDSKGRLNGEKLSQLAREHDLGRADLFAICGPGSMIEELTTSLVLLGVRREVILSERFGAVSKSRTPGERDLRRKLRGVALGADPSVMIPVKAHQGTKVYEFLVDPRESILGAAKRQGLDLPHSCEAGICGTCRAHLKSGKVDMATNLVLSEEEIASGFVLTCQGRASGDKVELVYPEKS